MRYLEQGIKHVVNWILGPGEEMLNGKQQVGYDIVSAEEYKRNHEAFELQCRVDNILQYVIIRDGPRGDRTLIADFFFCNNY